MNLGTNRNDNFLFLLGVLANSRQESQKQEIISLLIGDNDDYGEGNDDGEEDVDGNICY